MRVCSWESYLKVLIFANYVAMMKERSLNSMRENWRFISSTLSIYYEIACKLGELWWCCGSHLEMSKLNGADFLYAYNWKIFLDQLNRWVLLTVYFPDPTLLVALTVLASAHLKLIVYDYRLCVLHIFVAAMFRILWCFADANLFGWVRLFANVAT